ncbi:hypothetical protein OGM63_17000 [Plectonema radiosum NIES-515]|uniref:KGK family protein n=1 Tax=Plectonema radiosum NIES-515 TaxID=2986073 RepID=A0ABT3B1D9_9CYAN|nr:KGK domain-containing protein [Plectonema radiosum]MCV3215189.1 hypothetical protein [Plectonema radiosum NIES-515]
MREKKIFMQEVYCEVLNLGSKGWKKGKLRFKISVEFYLEEEDLEYPLRGGDRQKNPCLNFWCAIAPL